jgi:hypothetical protein
MSAVITCLVLAAATSSDVSALALAAGVEQRIDHCQNLKFEYLVTADGQRSPETPDGVTPGLLIAGEHVESKDVFKILAPDRVDLSVPLRCWQRYVRQGDAWLLDRFVGFDGRQSRLFVRKKTGEGRWHQANIVPFEDAHEYEPNVFDAVLLSDLNGIAQSLDPTHSVSHAADNHFRIVGRKEFQGRDIYSLEGQNERFGMRHRIDVTASPDFVIVRREVTSKDGRPHLLVEVTELREFDGLAYPAAGIFHQWAAGQLPELVYRFTVVEIERLSEAARQDWFPEWPPGTAVGDQVNNRNFSIPHDPRALEESRLIQLGGFLARSSGRQKLFFLVVNLLGTASLIFAIRRVRKCGRLPAR